MGRVYRARDLRLSRSVALKVLAPGLVGQREAIIRLQKEAETASRLNHPALVTIFDIGEAPDGQIFVAMELIDGVSLREWLRTAHSAAEICEVLSQAADGLAAAHAGGVIHRDVKPENLMIARQGFVKVVDFGLAKTTDQVQPSAHTPTAFMTEQGRIVGTVVYMAPEQLRGEVLDGACDVFALGSVLHEALSRRPPFAAGTSVETISRILHEAPPALPSTTDPRIVALVAKMLAKDPRARPSMAVVASELKAIARVSDPAVTAEMPSVRPDARRWTVAAAAFVLVASGGALLWFRRDPPRSSAATTLTAPADPRVAEVYAKAQFFASDRKWPVQDQSIPLLEEVVRRDPRFLPARTELAFQYARRAFADDPDRSWEQKAFVEADRILRIDPDSPAAHTIRAGLLWTKARGFPHEESLIELSKTLQRDPGYKQARVQRAYILMHVGLLDEAMADLTELRRQDPADSEIIMRIARIHLWQGDYATALREFREYTPDNSQIAIALLDLGRKDDALAFTEPRATDGDMQSVYALVLAALARRADAEKVIARAYEQSEASSHFHHALYNIACAWAQMGDAAKAVEALDRVSREGMPCYPLFARDPQLDPIRNDPRFQRFLADSHDAYEARKRSLARFLSPRT